MNVNLKKIKILEPKVKITTELKTISREPSSIDAHAVNVFGKIHFVGTPILGNIEILEV